MDSCCSSPVMPRRSGFTLIEIMIVIGIMAVIMAVSVPSMYRQFEKDTVRRMTQDVLNIFERARSRAIVNDRPVQLVIRPQERVFMVMPLQLEEGMTEQEYLSVELEKTLRREREAAERAASNGERTPPVVRNEDALKLSDRMTIRFIGVNFVPDLQENEAVPVRFYPNGTSDEFSMVIESDTGDARLFEIDVPTALLNWNEP